MGCRGSSVDCSRRSACRGERGSLLSHYPVYRSELRASFIDLLDERYVMTRGGRRPGRDFDAFRPAQILPCVAVVMVEDGPWPLCEAFALDEGASPLLRAGPSLCLASVLCRSRCLPLAALPLAARGPTAPTSTGHRYRDDRFSCSMPAPTTSSRHLYTGRHQGSTQAAPWLRAPRTACLCLSQGPRTTPGFGAIVPSIDASAVVHARSSSRRVPDPLPAGLFRNAGGWRGGTAPPRSVKPDVNLSIHPAYYSDRGAKRLMPVAGLANPRAGAARRGERLEERLTSGVVEERSGTWMGVRAGGARRGEHIEDRGSELRFWRGGLEGQRTAPMSWLTSPLGSPDEP